MARSISRRGRQCLGVRQSSVDPRLPVRSRCFLSVTTFNTNTRSEKDANTQIIIDADRGTVEGPGGGTNKYCTHESDWMTLSQGVQYKIIRECPKERSLHHVVYDMRSNATLKAAASLRSEISGFLNVAGDGIDVGVLSCGCLRNMRSGKRSSWRRRQPCSRYSRYNGTRPSGKVEATSRWRA